MLYAYRLYNCLLLAITRPIIFGFCLENTRRRAVITLNSLRLLLRSRRICRLNWTLQATECGTMLRIPAGFGLGMGAGQGSPASSVRRKKRPQHSNDRRTPKVARMDWRWKIWLTFCPTSGICIAVNVDD